MARTGQKEMGRSRKSRAAEPVADAIGSQALVNPGRGDGQTSDNKLRRNGNAEEPRDESAGQSGRSGGELEDWLAAKREFDRQLKRL